MIEHRSLVNAYLGWESAYQLSSLASHLQMANFSFDVFTGDVVRALCSGGKLVLCPREFLLTPEKLLGLLRSQKIEFAEFVPAVLRQLVQYMEETAQSLDFMRIVVAGSDLWPLDDSRRLQRLCRGKTRLINSYGLTEATIDSTYFELDGSPQRCEGAVPIGRPMVNTQCYLLDSTLQPVPIGVAGELCIGGEGLARGYLKQPEWTAQRFVESPRIPGVASKSQRLYRTGDLARYLPDGNIEYLGRIDRQVKIRGFRIELAEIEAAVSLFPEVADNVVVVREDRPGIKQLVGYVVTKQNVQLDTNALRNFLVNKLPDYLIPAAIVKIEIMPLSVNGKINQQALPMPHHDDVVTRQREPPRDALEQRLMACWESVLKVPQLGIDDNFFACGGHSLLVIQLVVAIKARLGHDLSVQAIFANPTIRQLAQVLKETNRPAGNSPLLALRGGAGKAPFFCVHPAQGDALCFYELAQQLDPAQPFYGLQDVGLYAPEAAVADVAQMAKLYIAAIRTVQPHGPYFLGGWSLGGVIAFEMAQQLACVGEEVKLLALFDTYAYFDPARNMDEIELSGPLARSLQLPISVEHDDEVEQDQQPGRVEPTVIADEFKKRLTAAKKNLKACTAYRPQTYQGRIHLFRATDNAKLLRTDIPQYELFQEPTLGWSKYCTRPIIVHPVQADHFTMLRIPYVDNLAATLSGLIAECTSAPGGHDKLAIGPADRRHGRYAGRGIKARDSPI